jgi:DNA-binding NarL/FixJ family response regulator
VSPHGLVLCDDLIFYSRIAGAARAAGLMVRQAKTAGDLVSLARQHSPGGVILDLQNPGLDLVALLAELKAACPAMPRVVAYGSHVETELLRAARQAGCDGVMPRSQFAKELEGHIGEWLRASPAE